VKEAVFSGRPNNVHLPLPIGGKHLYKHTDVVSKDTVVQKIILFSRWGVQLETDDLTRRNLTNKLNNAVFSSNSHFVSLIDNIHILRCADWDAETDYDSALARAVSDLNLLQGCLAAMDGCGAITIGTVYEFSSNEAFTMYRTSSVSIYVHKVERDWVSPFEFGALLMRTLNNRRLRDAFETLTPGASWFDIYRAWESLAAFHHGSHKLRSAFPGESKQIDRLTSTANSFRHIAGNSKKNPPPAMTHDEALTYLRSLLLRSAARLPQPRSAFEAGTEVQVVNLTTLDGKSGELKFLTPPSISTNEPSSFHDDKLATLE